MKNVDLLISGLLKDNLQLLHWNNYWFEVIVECGTVPVEQEWLECFGVVGMGGGGGWWVGVVGRCNSGSTW